MEFPWVCSECELEMVVPKPVCEHARCGHIGLKSTFETDSGQECPHCSQTEGETPVTTVGVLFQCDGCGEVFDVPPESCA
ncbi:hypothetical protein A6E15_00270 [Natrinema saccharevitans]|uniref:C2H2-type domain-containing protein n=1 Tax=Natrinema saccharevitans TaxID=301967 RepID=A0A1S8ASK5_9EURY|nr:hypothetical protein A6E15_00270 [Natrinema saccharevitans]